MVENLLFDFFLGRIRAFDWYKLPCFPFPFLDLVLDLVLLGFRHWRNEKTRQPIGISTGFFSQQVHVHNPDWELAIPIMQYSYFSTLHQGHSAHALELFVNLDVRDTAIHTCWAIIIWTNRLTRNGRTWIMLTIIMMKRFMNHHMTTVVSQMKKKRTFVLILITIQQPYLMRREKQTNGRTFAWERILYTGSSPAEDNKRMLNAMNRMIRCKSIFWWWHHVVIMMLTLSKEIFTQNTLV